MGEINLKRASGPVRASPAAWRAVLVRSAGNAAAAAAERSHCRERDSSEEREHSPGAGHRAATAPGAGHRAARAMLFLQPMLLILKTATSKGV